MTMHDISLKPRDDKRGSGVLVLEGTIKTYRYLEEDETAPEASVQGGVH